MNVKTRPLCPQCGNPLDDDGIKHGYGMRPCRKVESSSERKMREWREKVNKNWEEKVEKAKKKYGARNQ